MSLLDLLRSDGSIVVNKKLAHAIGIDAAIMYSELISKQFYFESRGQISEDGFFFNTIENMQEDTALSKYQQTKAIKKLVELELIHHKNRGLPQKRYFKINGNEQKIAETLDMGQKLKNFTIRSEEIKQLKVKKVNGNNTNVNNSKEIKEQRYLITETVNEAPVFNYYSQRFKDKFKKEHPTITADQLDNVVDFIRVMRNENDIDDEKWQEVIDEHFEKLSPKNNGSILSFANGDHTTGTLMRYIL